MVMAAGLVAGLVKKRGKKGGKGLFGGKARRRRRRSGVTMAEMQKILMIRTMVGGGGRGASRDPLVMMLTMKAMGGKL